MFIIWARRKWKEGVKEIGDEGDLDLVTTVRRMLIGHPSRLAAGEETCLARTDRTCMWPHMATSRLAPGVMKRRKIPRMSAVILSGAFAKYDSRVPGEVESLE